MLVLHAARAGARLWLWAEAPLHPPSDPEDAASGAAVPPVPEPGRKDPPPFLPFDAGPGRLGRALGEAAGGFVPHQDRFREIVGRFPVRGRRPIPSSPLVAEPPRGPGRIRLRPFRVTALALDLEEALTLLSTAWGRSTLGSGLPVSHDLAFWCDVVRLAGTLVAGQHVVPGLTEEKGRFRARWEPVFQGADLETLARLTRQMPGVARCLAEPDTGESTGPGADGARNRTGRKGAGRPPHAAKSRELGPDLPGAADPSPLELVRGFVAEMCDHLVRSAQWPHAILPLPADVRREEARRREEATSLDERWLDALRSPDPVLEGEPAEVRDLRDRLREWRRPLTRILDSPWRLTFRLQEPPAGGNGGPWHLDYLLQDAHDPSLIIPLEKIWAPRGLKRPEREALLRNGVHPREHLLQDLGQAARLSTVVEESLDTSRPAGAEIDSAAAYRFLREEAPLLAQAGFGVRLPAWWTRGRTRIRPSVRAVAKDALQTEGRLSLNELVSVHWEVMLGGTGVSAEELRTLAELKAPLVRFRGEWVEVDEEGLTEALDELARAEKEEVTASRLVRMAVGAEKGPAGLPVEDVRGEGSLGRLLEGLQGAEAFSLLPPPDGLRADLRPYQEKGYSWLAFLARWGLGACLADDMGLGKTIQTLALVQRTREEDGEGPVLVVCPTSVVTNWKREAARFTPSLRVRIHHGPDRPAGDDLEEAAGESDVILTTYALLFRDADDLARVPWRGLVLDEAQNIKNPDAKRSRAARNLPAGFRVALTGTPVENHVGDLWSIMETLNPGLLGNRSSFRQRFFLPIQSAGDPEATARLRRITGPFILRRLKTDRAIIQDLPERIETSAFCTLTPEQASLYAAVLKDLEEALAGGREGMERKGLVLATLTRLKQVCNHPAHFLDDGSPVPGRSGKVERLRELLEEILDSQGRALVFTQYTRMGEILRKHLQEVFGREVPFLHGGVSRGRRERMVDDFQTPGGPDVFLLSLKAGGTGLNLTAANHVFLFDRWWNPAVETQAADRAFRIGQKRNVQVHKFVCSGTLEEQIDRIIEEKKEVAGKVVGTGDAWLTELSDDELRDILALKT